MLPILLLLLAVSPALARKWTDTTGHFSVEAELVEVKDGKANLKKTDGTLIAVPLAKLSKADRDYLKSLEKNRKPDSISIGPGDNAAVPALVKALKDEDTWVRKAAVETLMRWLFGIRNPRDGKPWERKDWMDKG